MKRSHTSWLIRAAALGTFLLAGSALPWSASERVTLLRAPDGGIQPRTVMDAQGAVHMNYFTGDARGGDVFYVRRNPRGRGFTAQIRENSQVGSDVAVGTVRGPQIAQGRNGRVLVVWMGSEKAE
ncbi:MAG: hypothetical protein HYS33_00680, partial [Acidobacteria bacterium]|nr:hypothetical protein [Acidobacteriota bacterium]